MTIECKMMMINANDENKELAERFFSSSTSSSSSIHQFGVLEKRRILLRKRSIKTRRSKCKLFIKPYFITSQVIINSEHTHFT